MSSVNPSQYFEEFIKLGVMCHDRKNDPGKIGSARIHQIDQFNLNPPDDTQWAHSIHPSQSQIFGNNGKQFAEGEHGVGETPNNFVKGTSLVSMKATSDGQSTIVLGALPQVGSDSSGGGGS